MTYDNLNLAYKSLFIIVIAAICTIISIFPKYALLICGIILILLLILNFVKNESLIIYFLILLCVFQNFLAIIVAKKLGTTLMQCLILTKELIAYSTLLLVLIFNIKKIKLTLVELVCFIFIFILSIYLLVPSDVSLFLKLVQYRQILTPVILYLLGKYIFLSSFKLQLILKFLINLSIATVIFGILECLAFSSTFWYDLGINTYLSSKGMDAYASGLNGLPGNFYTYDYYLFIGTSLRRMVSFIADPTLLGQFLVLPICILLFTDVMCGKKRILYILLLTFGLILTLSKGGLFSLAIAFMYKLLKNNNKIFGILLAVVTIIFTIFILNNATMFSSIPDHINGLVTNFKLMISNPLGLGLGKAGNFSRIYSINDDTAVGESFIGLILGQMGIFTIVFLIFLICLIKELDFRNKLDLSLVNISIAFRSALIGTIISSFISESAISFISAGTLFLLSGILSSNICYRKTSN